MTRSRLASQALGRANKEVGDAFEVWVEAQHEAALVMGLLGHIHHNQPKAQKIKGEWVYVKPGVSDFIGVLLEGGHGRTLASEAKSTVKAYLERAEVKPAQARHLDAVAIAGGLAILLVEFRRGGIKNRYACPWQSVPWQVLKTAESVAEEAILEWKIVPGACYLARFVKPVPEIAVKLRQEGAVRGRVYPRE